MHDRKVVLDGCVNKTAIIIGASSGIGLALARDLAGRGYRLGIAARRGELLEKYAAEEPRVAGWKVLDLTKEDAGEVFDTLVAELGGVDVVYLSSGVGHLNPDLEWEPEAETIAINVNGFARLACAAMAHFEKQGRGQLVGISSVAALRGAGEAPAYGASKAFVSRYLQSLRFRARKSGKAITVTDVRPGFVDTAMMKAEKPFWVASPQKVAEQIVDAVEVGKKVVYVSRRWALIGWLLRHLPE
jgi:short-subunit dehydrogenase